METGEETQDDVIDQLLNQNKLLSDKNSQLTSEYSAFANQNKDANLVQYQLDSNDLLERLEHFYKGEYLTTDKAGNVYWKQPDDKSQIPLNSFGVSSLMEIVSKYIDRNTSLSYYSEMRIYEILADLGDELITFVLSNYEMLGMDNHFKKTKFRLLIVTTLHLIESTYRRAIGGATIKTLNESRIVSQSDNINSFPTSPQRTKVNIFNPRTWGH